jgi:tocopherol cyclase
MLNAIINPDLYHGHGKKENFFEGWYFKIADRTGKHRFAFIPGIFLGKGSGSHSFLQILDGATAGYDYQIYKEEAFWAHRSEFNIAVAGNRFSLDRLELNIPRPNGSIQGTLRLLNPVKWPDTWYRPGSMGYYNFLTFMQCYSQVCCMHAGLSGTLQIDGEPVDFSGGAAYIEKNWGRDFPYGWVWIQANHFSDTASISCSVGHIPFLRGSFRGFLIGFWHEGSFYPFTTMNRSSLQIERDGYTCRLRAENKSHTLQIVSSAAPESFILCKGPREDTMRPLVDESLSGTVQVTLTLKATGKILFNDTSHSGGIEYGGNQELVLGG